MSKRIVLCAVCLGVAIGLLWRSLGREPDPEPEPQTEGVGLPAPAASLRGSLHLAKSHRLALHWENGDFEIWDTEQGQRRGRVQRLPHPVGWFVASPDEAVIVTADRMPRFLDAKFVPTVCVWDARTGARKHFIRVPEAKGHPYYIHEWYARWLDDTRLLLVRILRYNPARCASKLKLMVVDTVSGKVVKASEEFAWAGEHLFLSPDRKMALVKDDNYMRRRKGRDGWEGLHRNIYARTHVIDLEGITVAAAWPEPPDATGEERIALDARWCPDGKTVLTVGTDCCDDHFCPKVRLWDARSGVLQRTFSGHSDYILDVALTASGDRLLTASEDRTLRVWDTRKGKAVAVLEGHTAGLNRVVVLPGDKLAVSAAEEPVAKVWDLTDGKLKFDLPGHDSAVRELEVVSDGVVRTVSLRGTATTWDCTTGKRLRVTPRPPDFPKRFGVCELAEEGGTLRMRVVP